MTPNLDQKNTPVKICDKKSFWSPVPKCQNFTFGPSSREISRFTKKIRAGPPLNFKYLLNKKKEKIFDDL